MERELVKVRNLESLGVLAGGIAHDFNNILTSILGNISYIKLEFSKESEAGVALVEAETACRHAQHLTKQLLTFSSGGQPVKKTASLEEIIKETVSFSLRGSDVSCQLKIADNLWPVRVDPGQISQAITNLVINADEANPNGGIIEIQVDNTEINYEDQRGLQPGRYVRIKIRDQGIGINQDHLSRIFEPFFSSKKKGRGLGLAITFSIINKHQGLITVDSVFGEGTTFTIFLPAADEKYEAKKEDKDGMTQGEGRILVMDDEEAVLKLAARMLNRLGYDVQVAEEGSEAVEKYREAHGSEYSFDAVILDLTVKGGLGGIKTLEQLKEIDPEVKAIISSGYSDDSAMSDHKKAGFAGVICKPYDIKTMSQVLSKVVMPGNDY